MIKSNTTTPTELQNGNRESSYIPRKNTSNQPQLYISHKPRARFSGEPWLPQCSIPRYSALITKYTARVRLSGEPP